MRAMLAENQLPFVVFVTAVAAGCGRTPEPPGLERAAQAAGAAVAEPRTTPAAQPLAVPASATLPNPSSRRESAEPSKPSAAARHSKLKRVIVIAMENHDADEIYSDAVNA